MTTRVVTQPSVEPVSLDEAKLHLRVDDTTDDSLITALITVARIYAENYTRRSFCQQTLELLLNCFDSNEIILPAPPLISVSSVKYLDLGGVLTTVDVADYQVDTYREPGRIKPAYLESWPIITRGDFNAVQIQYVAGYTPIGSPTDYASGVPEPIKQWIKIRVATLYEFREAIVTGTSKAEIHRDFIDGLLDPYVVDLF